MALTVTATRKLQVAVENILGMKNPASVIIVPPFKPAVGIFKTVQETLVPIPECLIIELPHLIVYIVVHMVCARTFLSILNQSFGNKFTEPPNSMELSKHGLVPWLQEIVQ